jgi:hypothetical protein
MEGGGGAKFVTHFMKVLFSGEKKGYSNSFIKIMKISDRYFDNDIIAL